MSQTLTQRLDLIKNNPGTNEQVSVAEINSAFDNIDANLVPAAKIRKAAGTQAIVTATTTTVDYDSVSYDTWSGSAEGAMADITANTITAKIDGLYHVEAGVCFDSNVTGFRALGVALNGAITPFKLRHFITGLLGGVPTPVKVSGDIPMVAGDVLTVRVIQNSGVNLNLDQSGATAEDAIYLSATWIGKKP